MKENHCKFWLLQTPVKRGCAAGIIREYRKEHSYIAMICEKPVHAECPHYQQRIKEEDLQFE